MSTDKLKKGDQVVMHTCIEAETHAGHIWTCRGDQFTRGTGVYAQDSVFLEGFSGSFAPEFLQKVNVEDVQGIPWIKYDSTDRSIESHVNHIVSDGNTTLIAQHAVFNGKYYWHINESLISWVKYYAVINLPVEEGDTEV
ncbi:hypothetical protein [Paenibacillus nuruki]|uniref:hypothetical protein n=1 Tax=Paenibacillus nuruki TaxID=1886670 RepID=UPI002803C5B3|nr:hypothetical protein [Paenibacillus nuruki]CAJ1315943.1 hypothetical protein AASFL403_12025 [Paenibacillus nuruki]